jgi:hypothetical protein
MAITAVLLSATPALAQVPAGTVTINSAVLISPFQIGVTGSIECVAGEQYVLNVFVRQQGPQQTVATGFNSTGGACTATGPQTWTVTATADSRTFNPGKTLIRAEGNVCDPDFISCSPGTAERTLQVKRR